MSERRAPDAEERHPTLGVDPGGDPEYEQIRDALSLPPSRADLTRRRFLQAMLATAGGAAVLNTGFAEMAAAVAPLGVTDGVLVVIQLGGGNDGLNTVVPVADPAYRLLRPQLSTASGSHPLGTSGFALHPALPKLAARFAAGKVAIVNGVGNPAKDLSHFSSMATWLAGTASTARDTGWLGRWLDTLADSPDGMRAASVGTNTPLHLAGTRAHAASLGWSDPPYGSDTTADWEQPTYQSVLATGMYSTGLGALPDSIAQLQTRMISHGRLVRPATWGNPVPAGDLVPSLDMAARLINLNLGMRVISVATKGSFDTHAGQLPNHQARLFDLDVAIDRFYQVLAPAFAGRVVLMTFSEFGRRARGNGAAGTDHGTAAPMLVVGDRVAGGMYGSLPSLTSLDVNGNLAVTVDFRRVYASVLHYWLKGDPTRVLGGSYPTIPLFRAGPG